MRNRNKSVKIHEHKNAGCNCYICKQGLNRTARKVPYNGQQILVCRDFAQKYGMA